MTFIATIGVAVAIFVAALCFTKLFRRGGRKAPPGLYRLRKDALFSQGERAFFDALEPALPRGVRIFGKVRLADIFTTSDQVAEADRFRVRGRINQKHVDFLLVREDDLSPLAGVELDDRSHDASDRQERDAFVDSVFASGGIPLMHFPAQHSYDRGSIRAQILARLYAA